MQAETYFNIRKNVSTAFFRMIEECKKTFKDRFKSKFDNFILVVDDATLKILNQYIPYPSLIEKKVQTVEKLELKRKPFPNFHALYFISPCKKSIDLIEKDYTDDLDDNGIPEPTYMAAHVVFHNYVSEEIQDYLAKKEKLIPRIANIKNLYLDFKVIDNSQIDLGHKGMLKTLYSGLDVKQKTKAIETLADQVSTFVTAMPDWNHVKVVYNTGSAAEEIGKKVTTKLKRMVQEGNNSKKYAEHPLVIIIMDRTRDPVSPLLHDQYYYNSVYDLLEIDNNEYIYEYMVNDQKKMKTMKQNEMDSLWLKFRNKPFIQAYNEMVKERNDFVKMNQNLTHKKDKKKMNTEDMVSLISQMPEIEDKAAELNGHLDLMDTIKNRYVSREIFTFTNRGQNMNQNIDMEQTMATGYDKNLNKAHIKYVEPNYKFNPDNIRYNQIYYLTTELSQNEDQKFTDQLDLEEKTYLKALSTLRCHNGKFKLDLQNATDKNNKNVIDEDRSAPVIKKVIESIREKGEIPEGFKETIVNEENILAFPDLKRGPRGLQQENIETIQKNAPVFQVFIPGGISTNEIREIRSFEDPDHHDGILTICAGTEFMSPLDYLNSLKMVLQEDPEPEDVQPNVEVSTYMEENKNLLQDDNS